MGVFSVSIVVPIYNEAENLRELTHRLKGLISEHPDIDWDVIYVDDGSTDDSAVILEDLVQNAPWLTAISLSRNFGHQIATTAGLDQARGDAVVLMDGDLQDPPELIPKMIQLWKQGFDVVYATREHRQGETPFKRFTASVFYRLLHRVSDTKIPIDTGDFRLMSRRVVDALRQMPERSRFLRGMVSWVGFPQTAVYYQRQPRLKGKTKFGFFRMLRFAVNGVLSFSLTPLHAILTLGILFSLASFLGILLVLYETLILKTTVRGWSSLMVAVLFMGGIQLICLGMIGQYVGRIFDEVRNRPLYLIRRIQTQSAFRVKTERHEDQKVESL